MFLVISCPYLVGTSAAGETRTLTPLLTGALKAPVSTIPPPRHFVNILLLLNLFLFASAVCSSIGGQAFH